MGAKSKEKKIAGFLVILIISILVVWFLFGNTSDEDVEFEEDEIILINSSDEEIEMTVMIAEDEEERKQGLMNQDSLCKYCGMLFVYEEDVRHGFWMKDTQIPLSIAFISEDGTIMEIQQMEPETTDIHRPEETYRYALEVNQGFFQENGIGVGEVVSIPDAYR
ncbi:MAG: DUF192 domain-containing protein [Candidatus Aenigmatarchaeota archaeon]